MLSEMLYSDAFVLMSETILGHINRFGKWMEAFESKGLNGILGKTKVGMCRGITSDGLSKSMLYSHGIGDLRVNANSVLC